MNFTTKAEIVLVCRSEIEKTPKTVYPHEIAVLEVIHGPSRIERSDAAAPIGVVELDAEAEFARLLTEYAPRGDKPDPVIEVYRNFDGFLAEVMPEQEDKPRRGRAAKAV